MITDEERQMKRMLWEYGSADDRIKDINIQIKLQKETKQSMRDISSARLDGLPFGSAVGDPVAGAAIKIVDRVEMNLKQLISELDDIYEMQDRMRNLLSCLNREEHRLIEWRYIKRIRWNSLPSRMHCSRSTCFNIHDRAMRKLIAKNKSLD